MESRYEVVDGSVVESMRVVKQARLEKHFIHEELSKLI